MYNDKVFTVALSIDVAMECVAAAVTDLSTYCLSESWKGP